MKKLLSMILVAVTLLSLTACIKFGENIVRVTYTNEELADEFGKLQNANSRDRLIEKYGSYTVSWNQSERNYTSSIYNAADHEFWCINGSTAVYCTDDLTYVSNGTGPDDFETYCIINMYGGNLGQYTLLPETFEDYLDAEKDTFDSAYIKDGLMHYKTVYGEERGQETIAAYTDSEKPGWTLYAELTFDAETYEAVEYVHTMEKDGETKIISDVKASYADPVPPAAYALRSSFERTSVNMMTVTIIMDFNTDHEIKKTVTMPKNCECSFYANDVPSVYFTDPQYTTVSHWDRLSDCTMYIVTNPNEELVKRYNAIIAAQTAEYE